MNVYKFKSRDRGFALWTIPCILSLFMAILFLVPSVVFAESAVLSQECEFALINAEHVITATVTEDDGTPAAEVSVIFYIGGASANNGEYWVDTTDPDGIATFPYTGSKTGTDIIELYVLPNWDPFLGSISTTWTDNEADLCSGSQQVLVGGRMLLNVKKKGALKIAVCAVDGLDVNNVNVDKVQLAGVAPWHSKQKDSRLCPDGKDGVVDLVLKFKNREIVEALGPDLEDGDRVDLVFTGELNDKTPIEGKWEAVIIKKKGKRHGNNNHYQDNKNGKAKGHDR